MQWDLTTLYPSFEDKTYLSDCAQVSEKAQALLCATQTFDGSAEALTELVKEMVEVTRLLTKTLAFAQLTLQANSADEAARAASDRIEPSMIVFSRAHSALARKLSKMENLKEMIESTQALKEFSFLLLRMQEEANHSLAPEIENAVLQMQMTGGTAWEQLRDQVTSTLTVEIDGESMPLPAARNLAYDADAAVREKAYKAELAAYPKIEIPMAACLNGIKGEANLLATLKGHDSVLDMTLFDSLMSKETLDALLSALKDSFPMFREFFRLKAKMLGYEGGLKFCDLFAPVGKIDKRYTLEEAKELLIKELGAFSPRMGGMIQRAFDERWIDMYPREGKAGGAFCEPMHPLGTSFVLTNFDGSYSSVSTLAHELGHAYQAECMNDVNILNATCPMQLAETASTFNETLLAARIMENADRDTQIALLETQVSDGAQVIVDIMSRYLFEYEVIETRKDHALSAKELCAIMEKAQLATYGDGLDPECLHPYMWACKSHYYSTGIHFYNFPYAFGQLFALGVFAQYEEQGASFLPTYEKLLRESGLGTIEEVAASVGINVRDKAFWEKSLGVYQNKLDMLKKLVNEA